MASSDESSEGARKPRRFSATRTNLIQSRGKPISHDCLRDTPFFRDRDPGLLDILMENLQVEVFLPGNNIITQGDDGDCMYFMYRGEVEVLVGEGKRVATLRDGSLFGEMALLGNGKRAATIRAISVCDCRVINATAFHTCLKRFPSERGYFQKLAQERLAEIKKTSEGKVQGGFRLKAPSEPLSKFSRASHVIMAAKKLQSVSALSSRATTHTEDLGALADEAKTCSRVSTWEDMPDETLSPRSPQTVESPPSVASPTPKGSRESSVAERSVVLPPAEPVIARRPSREQAVQKAVQKPKKLDSLLDNLARAPDSPPAYARPRGFRRASREIRLPDPGTDTGTDTSNQGTDTEGPSRRASDLKFGSYMGTQNRGSTFPDIERRSSDVLPSLMPLIRSTAPSMPSAAPLAPLSERLFAVPIAQELW